MGMGGTPQVPTVDPDPSWLKQEEYQAGAYETQQQMILAKGDTANFMARYGVRANLAPGTITSATSSLYPVVGMMDPGGLGGPGGNPENPNNTTDPLSYTTAGKAGSIGVTGR